MKKIIFLVLFLKSFLFSLDGVDCSTLPDYYNPATDLAVAGSTNTNTYYGTYDIYPPKKFCSPSNSSFTAFVSLSISLISTNWYKSTYNRNYTITKDYTGCPAGQEIINGACAVPPTCDEGWTWDSNTDTCLPPPPELGDDDGDGILNKCDPEYVDYLTMDCDGDLTSNSFDTDIDGDGIPNDYDLNPNVAGTADSDTDYSCKGAKVENSLLQYPFFEYKFYALMNSSSCSQLIYTDALINHSVAFFDINPKCIKDYCYIHPVDNKCNTFDVSFYRPNSSWDYVREIVSESECKLLEDNIKYSDSKFVKPNDLTCPNTGFCFVERIDTPTNSTNTEDTDEKMQEQDLNSTSSDLAPLLNAQNTTNKHLDDLKNKTDDINQNLNDLKSTAKDTLDTNKLMSGILSDLKSNSDSSLSNQLQSLTSLSSINKNLGTMSDTVTSNQVIGNGHLNSIDGKMTTNNALLTNIDSTQTDTKDLIQELRDFFIDGNSTSSQESSLDFISSEFGNILSKYTVILEPSCGAVSSASFSVFGKTVTIFSQETLNILPIAELRLFIIFMFTVLAVSLSFRTL